MTVNLPSHVKTMARAPIWFPTTRVHALKASLGVTVKTSPTIARLQTVVSMETVLIYRLASDANAVMVFMDLHVISMSRNVFLVRVRTEGHAMRPVKVLIAAVRLVLPGKRAT